MRWRIRKCPQCKQYTIKSVCPRCNIETIVPHPPRFSPEDKYVEYRIKIKYPDLLTKLESKLQQTQVQEG